MVILQASKTQLLTIFTFLLLFTVGKTSANGIASIDGGCISPYVLNSLGFDYSTYLPNDSIIYPIDEKNINGNFVSDDDNNPFDLDEPKAIQREVRYDPETGNYILTEKIGGRYLRYPTEMSFEEYWEYQQKNIESSNWHSGVLRPTSDSGSGGPVSALESAGNSILKGFGVPPKLSVKKEDLLKNIGIGPDLIQITPTGNVDLEFGFNTQYIDNPFLLSSQKKQGPFFLFDMGINMGVIGKIGDNMKINLNYNTKANFDFENQIKLEYIGDEDEIIQEVRAGFINFPLPTTLIPGSQSLFGIQTKLKFGRLTVNSVLSQQRSKSKNVTIQNGAQQQEFEVSAFNYDANRHFFLSQFFRENYETAVQNYPYINSPIMITRLEVYVNDTRATPEDVQRDVVALTDLAEESIVENNNVVTFTKDYPANDANNLYRTLYNKPEARLLDQVTQVLEQDLQFRDVRDFRKTRARRLDPNEFTYDPQLGYVSLNFTLRPNEVLAVAYEYTTIYGGQYQVGEFAEDVFNVDENRDPRVLFLKMLKTTTLIPGTPIWDLMMRNVYSLGAYQVQREDFKLDIYYENPAKGDIRYLPEGEGVKGIPLIRLFGMDRLNSNNEPYSDGIFDFLETKRDFQDQTLPSNAVRFGTINTRNGRLIFPVLEPFGDYLDSLLVKENNNPQQLADRYTYRVLYDSTQMVTTEFPEFDRFYIRGTYKSSVSSEISLGAFNIPKNSVRVTAGGKLLREGVDYEINYGLGRITILNEAYINAGTPISVDYEDNATFGLQQKSYMGTRLDYWINDNFTLGATAVRLSERPFTAKVNYGEDPIANAMVGTDLNFFKDAPGITRFVDKIPGLDTKEPSSVSISAEGAVFLPGHSRAVNVDDKGTIYIDDFEGANTPYPLHTNFSEWILASTPRRNDDLFAESGLVNDWAYGYNRSRISWYQLDNVFSSGGRGLNISSEVLSNDATCWSYTRTIREQELFPNKASDTGVGILRTFDLSYFPEEKGPYNYDVEPTPYSKGITKEGKLKDPKSRWGGVMRESPHKDFEAVNVEFIEFWVLDPFMYSDQARDETIEGDLYLNLGNVSEDVLKDARQFYENALPGPSEVSNTDLTTWANVPKIRPIAPGFDNDVDARVAQDIGFDGMSDEEEEVFLQAYLQELAAKVAAGDLTQEAYNEILADPALDNFKSFIDEDYNSLGLDSNSVSDGVNIIKRYKAFNGPEGNSPVQPGGNRFGQNNGIFGASNIPEKEDLNRDNAMNDSENYFEYKISFKHRDEMKIGENYLAGWIDTVSNDRRCSAPPVKERWYHYRVPIDQFTGKVGDINFRNIEFIRMYLTNFDDPVTFRFARLNLVRNNWRKYSGLLREAGEYVPANNDNATDGFFNVSAVSFNDNGGRIPIPYVLPPGITREQLPNGTATLLRQDERAISAQIRNLPDGEAKAIYNRVNMDMRQFGSLRLFIHGEELLEGDQSVETLQNGDVSVFVRLGDDFTNNYYEYEIPLILTRPDDSKLGLLPESPEKQVWVWPYENNLNVILQDLVDTKLKRNFESSTFPIDKPYIRVVNRTWDGEVLTQNNGEDTLKAKITVVGSPDLGKVKQMMMGVRNPKQNARTKVGLVDDGLPKSVEVWFNELRLADFDEDAGYAGLARMDVKLADFGSINLSTNAHTRGFGTLEQKVNDRFRDNYVEYNASTNLELGKFLPEKSGIRVPFYAGITQSFSNPEYDPYDTDIFLKQKLDSIRQDINPPEPRIGGEQAAKDYKKQAQTATTIKSINVTNVRKERTNPEKKPRIYDVENLSATYAYTETDIRDPIVESDNVKQHRASLAYNYNARPKYWEPFSKLIKSKSLYLRPFKEFNINLIPSSLTFRNDINRRLGTLVLRNDQDDGIDPQYLTSYDKSLTWDRIYGLRYNPTKSISLDFNATNRSVVDENPLVESNWPTIRDTLKSVGWGGRTRGYEQSANISYNLPLDKIPLLSWTQLRTRYGSTYYWEGAPRQMADTLGNIIGNTQSIQLNADLDFNKLYNSIPFLKKVNARSSRRPPPKKKTPKGEKAPPKEEKAPKPERKPGEISKGTKALLRPLLMLRRMSLAYTEKNQTVVPGYDRSSNIMGMNWKGAQPVPGWDFIFGSQPDLKSWLEWAASEEIFAPAVTLNDMVRQAKGRTLTGRMNLEPFNDFKIDLNTSLSYSKNHSQFYKVNKTGQAFQHLSNVDVGSYSISYFMGRTLRDAIDTVGISETFRNFERMRPLISERLATAAGDLRPFGVDSLGQDYFYGYGPYASEVLIPAFLGAYRGKDASQVNLNPFNQIPIPNWRINYNGLSRIPAFNNIFSSVNLTHAYNSTLSINNYRNNLEFQDLYFIRGNEGFLLENERAIIEQINDEYLYLGNSSQLDTLTFNYYSFYQIPDVVVTEQFAPLAGIDLSFKNGLTGRFEWRRTRTVGLSLQNYQLTESNTKEVTFGAGYRIKGLNIPFIRIAGKEFNLQNDIAFNFDFAMRDNTTSVILLDQDTQEPASGSRTIRFSPTIDYVVNQQLRLQLFYEYNRTVPKLSTSYPITNTKGGLRVNFTLTQ